MFIGACNYKVALVRLPIHDRAFCESGNGWVESDFGIGLLNLNAATVTFSKRRGNQNHFVFGEIRWTFI